ncbi:hypothetical protein [Thioclava sp. GXIMD4215]|uniref:hypothetical protein n=1 Tax=Thioclava sp. GXIMD4215 TaxID=3131928 RepID=UPI0032455C19
MVKTLVIRRMAVRVVNLFKMIDVDEDQAGAFADFIMCGSLRRSDQVTCGSTKRHDKIGWCVCTRNQICCVDEKELDAPRITDGAAMCCVCRKNNGCGEREKKRAE